VSAYQMPRRAPQAERCVLTHEMNNCLSIILGECELLLDAVSEDAGAMKRVKVIALTAQRWARGIRVEPCPAQC